MDYMGCTCIPPFPSCIISPFSSSWPRSINLGNMRTLLLGGRQVLGCRAVLRKFWQGQQEVLYLSGWAALISPAVHCRWLGAAHGKHRYTVVDMSSGGWWDICQIYSCSRRAERYMVHFRGHNSVLSTGDRGLNKRDTVSASWSI